MDSKFSIRARFHSMTYALAGIKTLLKEEHNARVHLCATVVVLTLAFTLGASISEWLILLLAIALVWVAEALNSAIEYIGDRVCPHDDPLIGKAKDVAAAGVFIAAFIALLCGLLVFLPLMRAAL